GKRQHLFLVTLSDNGAKDITPFDHDAPTIATGGDGDVAVSPDGKEIAFAMHADSSVADNTNVDVYAVRPDGSGLHAVTTGAVAEERGRDNLYRIDVPTFHRSVVVGNSGLNTNPSLTPDGKTVVYLHQSNTQTPEVWASGRQLTRHNDQALAALDSKPLEEFGFVGALGDSVFGWILKPPGFDPARRYPLVYLVHGGPQGAWTDYWGARWNYAMFAARGYVVAAV